MTFRRDAFYFNPSSCDTIWPLIDVSMIQVFEAERTRICFSARKKLAFKFQGQFLATDTKRGDEVPVSFTLTRRKGG